MAQFEEENPEFFLGYRNARRIGKTPANPRSSDPSVNVSGGGRVTPEMANLGDEEEAFEGEGVILDSGE